ncbi:MAG: hypothetical protein ASARMPREDX12_002076 [Alectoria sarmentosa]|nr:MAG: hypothetical protein ASARMPREDX12_002076 [Alectoria sarmentosa]
MVRRNNSTTPSNVGRATTNVGRNHGSHEPSNVGRLNFTPSTLGTINETSSNLRSIAGSSGGVDDGPDDDDWQKKDKAPKSHDHQNLVTSMKELDINRTEKAQPRASECDWRQSSLGSVRTMGTERQQRQRAHGRAGMPNPPTMSLADDRQPYTFPKHEFKRGMIFRAPLHEEDYMGASHAAYSAVSEISVVAASNMSTASGLAKNHQIMTDFGPVYSEYRFMIVVVLGPDTYTALPFYTHSGNGTAYKQGKDDYVSVQDYRCPEKCVRQSKHDPVCTEILKEKVKTLHEFTTAHLGNAVSRKYRLPIAHQGRLTDKDTDRLVSLFKNWVVEH